MECYITSDEEDSKENDKSEKSEIKVAEVVSITEADLKYSPISSKKGQGYSARNIMVKQRKPLVSTAIIAKKVEDIADSLGKNENSKLSKMRPKPISAPINPAVKGLVNPSILTSNVKEDDVIIEEELESYE